MNEQEFTGYMVDETSMINPDFDYHSVYRSREFQECMTYFDTGDKMTRMILLSVNEADQALMMNALAAKLYSHIINKIDDIDFGTIPNSRGDIKRIDNYEQLCDCLNVLSQVLMNYKQDTTPVDTIQIALENMIDRREEFIRAYRLNAEMPIVTYNTIALSIVSATSLLISSHIEYIKMPDDRGYNIAFDKSSKLKSREKVLFNNLERFNKMCSSGELDKTLDYVMKGNVRLKSEKHESVIIVDEDEPQDEAALSVGTAIGAIGSVLAKAPVAGAKVLAGGAAKAVALAGAHPIIAGIAGVILGTIILIKLLRDVIFYFYYARTKVSEYCDLQAGMLYMNAMNVENNLTRDEGQRKKIASRQKKVADFLSKAADKIKVKDRSAENSARSDSKKADDEKFVYSDVVDSIPDSANTSLF